MYQDPVPSKEQFPKAVHVMTKGKEHGECIHKHIAIGTNEHKAVFEDTTLSLRS